MKAVVLGCGMVGSAIAEDLARHGEYSVRVCDISSDALERVTEDSIEKLPADLSDPNTIRRVTADADVVVGAVPGFMGYRTLRNVITAGKDIVDISFFPEEARGLDDLARKNGVRCLVDFGIAPGCSNLICGYSAEVYEEVRSFTCMVGGLPEERRLPWEYQAPFSPCDVLEEYTRPARYVRGGEVVTEMPLTGRELADFRGIGTLEAFLTDGLRSLLKMEGIDNMVEKTLRYPGYADKILLLKDSGMLSTEAVDVEGVPVRPLEVTSRLLFEEWKQHPGDRDFTVMRIKVEGLKSGGTEFTSTWNLLDRYDEASSTTSMARTTGYTCTAGVRMLAEGLWKETGVHPPEDVGTRSECFDFIIDELKKRNVIFRTEDS